MAPFNCGAHYRAREVGFTTEETETPRRNKKAFVSFVDYRFWLKANG